MRGIQSYRKSSVEGARQDELLLMLVETLVLRIERADAAMEAGARSEWNEHLRVSREILLELRTALDHALAPEITDGLDRTYRWLVFHLVAAGRTGDRERLAEVRRVAGVVLHTWTEAVRMARLSGREGLEAPGDVQLAE